jgi:6-phosphogluconolactonase
MGHRASMVRALRALLLAPVLLATMLWSAPASGAAPVGAVYAMTNDVLKNEIVVYHRAADGTLTIGERYATGGTGSGTVENSANGLILTSLRAEQSPNNLSDSARFLIATNTGSDSITVFKVRGGTLERASITSSGGDHPISVTVSRGLLYVLNGGLTNCSGGAPMITGFTINAEGKLRAIPNSTRRVSGGTISGCAQVSFNPAGTRLVVTQRVADTIDVFLIGEDGRPQSRVVNQSTGLSPFGFTFTRAGQLLTTESAAGAPLLGAVAAYRIKRGGALEPLGPSVPNLRSDTCWIVVTDNGTYAYASNFQSGDISSYRVAADGTVTLLESTAGVTGPGAFDIALSNDSHYLYARNVVLGSIVVFRIEENGRLTALQQVGGLPPVGAIGIAAS